MTRPKVRDVLAYIASLALFYVALAYINAHSLWAQLLAMLGHGALFGASVWLLRAGGPAALLSWIIGNVLIVFACIGNFAVLGSQAIEDAILGARVALLLLPLFAVSTLLGALALFDFWVVRRSSSEA